MGGSESKQPRPSYEDGKVRDPRIAVMQAEAAEESTEDDQEQRGGLIKLLRKAIHRPTSKSA